MLYELINPCDRYTFEATDDETAEVVALLLGGGKTPVVALDGMRDVGGFTMFQSEEAHANSWAARYGRSLADSVARVKPNMPAALRSLVVGKRDLWKAAREFVPEEKRAEFDEVWHDKNRTSQTDYRSWALAEADQIEKDLVAKEPPP